MKVKSFRVSLTVGSSDTSSEVLRIGLKDLDEWTNELGATAIHSINDTVVSMGGDDKNQYLLRTVVYS